MKSAVSSTQLKQEVSAAHIEMTYYDRLNAFFRANDGAPLPASAQLLYLHLLHMNNQNGNVGWLRFTENQMAVRTRLNRKTVAEARRALEVAGLIQCETITGNPRAGTICRLINLGEKPEPEPEIKPLPAPRPQYLSQNSAAVLEAWKKCGGGQIPGFELITLENCYGAETLIKFIEVAAMNNKYPVLTVKFLKATINRGVANGLVPVAGIERQYAGADDELPAEYRHYQGRE